MGLRTGAFQASAVTGTTILGTFAVGVTLNQGSTNEAIRRIDKDVVRQIDALEKTEGRIINEIAKVERYVNDIASRMEMEDVDLEHVIVQLGIAKETDVFSAAIIGGALWTSPDDELASRLSEQGLVRRPVDDRFSASR